MSQAAQSIIPGAATANITWDVVSIENLLSMPFADLIFKAQQIHRQHFAPNAVQLSTLLSIKTGGCPEDCGYWPRAAKTRRLCRWRQWSRPRARQDRMALRVSAWARRGAVRSNATSKRLRKWSVR